jgi:WXG100 family type VII secretion target
MGSGDDRLVVSPAVLASTGESVGAAAEHLLAGLSDLDAEVVELLGLWTGAAGGSYAQVWRQWHEGAQKVQAVLMLLAEGLGRAGRGFEANESAAQETLGLVDG